MKVPVSEWMKPSWKLRWVLLQLPPPHILYTLEPWENRWGQGYISAWGGHREEGMTVLSDKVWLLQHFLYREMFIDWIVGGSQASDSVALISDGNLFHNSIRGKKSLDLQRGRNLFWHKSQRRALIYCIYVVEEHGRVLQKERNSVYKSWWCENSELV